MCVCEVTPCSVEPQHACAAETACNLKLATLCKMVEFIGHYEENKVAASSSLVSAA